MEVTIITNCCLATPLGLLQTTYAEYLKLNKIEMNL
jgi:hypothetical protein